MQEMWVPSLGQEDTPREGNDYPLQYSCLGNPMDRGAWWATVHGVTKRVGHELLTKQQQQQPCPTFQILKTHSHILN